MLYYLGSGEFKRKIWNFFESTYRRRLPESEREPISPQLIERYIGVPIHRYREYIAQAASAAGHELDCYKLKWRIVIPKPEERERLYIQSNPLTNFPEFHYLNHRLEYKQLYLNTLSTNNHVLTSKMTDLIDNAIQASIVFRSKNVKTHALKLENLLLYLLNEQLTEDNRIVVRIVMNSFNMPFTKWALHGYYRNCAISLDANLSNVMSSVSKLSSREPEFSVGKSKRGKGSRLNDKG